MYRATIATSVGGGAGWPALAWALEEAAATDGRLEICHVCPADSPLAIHTRCAEEAAAASRANTVPVGLLELADPPLARAVAAAKSRLGGDRVTLTIHTGRVDRALLLTSAHADLMVLAAGGRTTHQVATHAHCPAVVVRPDTSTRHGPFAGHVVVGVDGSRPARTALEFAMAYAAKHRWPLAAVHVDPHRDNDTWSDDEMLQTHLTAEPTGLTMLAAEVEPWSHEYPAVAVKHAVYTGRPLSSLLQAATGARLLVVGHRGHGLVARAVLGSVAYGVIDHATGPTAVTHAQDTHMSLTGHSTTDRELVWERP
jgi:nucleotide-binding universal stress UspA family protein